MAKTPQKIQWIIKSLWFFSLFLYLLSFLLPTFEIVVDGKPLLSYGYQAFAIGFFSISSPGLGGLNSFIPWLANPTFWVGIHRFLTGRSRGAIVAGILAVVMSATLWFLCDPDSRSLFLIGYYLWVISMVLFTVAALMRPLTS